MKIAYLISCYKLPNQVVNLVKRLQHSDDLFLIHLDKKSSNSVASIMMTALKKYKNVIFLERHNCNWGDFGHVKATLKGISYIENNSVAFTNFVVLTGQDFPVKSLEQTRAMIKQAQNSMEYFKMPTAHWAGGGMNRLEYGHYWIFGKHVVIKSKLYKRKAIQLIKEFGIGNKPSYYGGSSYFQLEAPLIKYIYSLIQDKPEIVHFFKHTFISDEIFFQTLLLNSPYRHAINNASRRYVDWTHPTEMPKILRIDDVKKIKSSDAIFARKIDETIDHTIIKELIR